MAGTSWTLKLVFNHEKAVMPYLRMFLAEQQVDEVFISDTVLESVLGNHFLEEEKQHLLKKHAIAIKELAIKPSFDIFPSLNGTQSS